MKKIMTKRTTVGIVIVMLHLLQRCSATNVTTTVVMNDETSSTPSATLQPNSSISSTSFDVSENSDSYVQNGDPKVSTDAVSSTSTTTTTAAVGAAEQVANTSPTKEPSTYSPLIANDKGNASTQSTTVTDSDPATLFPIQNNATSSNKSSDDLVSSSKVNMTDDSVAKMDKSEVGTDAHGSIAETEVVDTNKSETQPETTNEEDQIEKKDKAGVKIGEADVRDDDDDDEEEFSEPLITDNSDTEKSETSNTNSKVDQTPKEVDQTPKEVDGIEVELLADDMQEDIVQDDDTASEGNDEIVTQSSTEGTSIAPNNATEFTTKTGDDNSSSDTGNVATTQSGYETSFNKTEQQTNAAQGESSKGLVQASPNEDNGTTFMQDNANPFQVLNFPNFGASNTDLGNGTAGLDQSTSTPTTPVPSDIHNASTSVDNAPKSGSASNIPQSFGGFQEVQLLAADISLDEPADQGLDKHKTATNNQNADSDSNPNEESGDDNDSNSEPKLPDSDGIYSGCNTSLCESSYNQTTFNNTSDAQNDPDNMPNLPDTSVGSPSSYGSQSNQANEDNSPALDATVGNTPANETVDPNASSKAADEVVREQDPDEVSENGEGSNPIPADETQNLQESNSTLPPQAPIIQETETKTNGQQFNNTYQVPPGSVLKILFENGEIASVSTDPHPNQVPAAIEANEGDKQRDATSNDDAELYKAEEHIELLADDFVFGEDENGTAGEADRQDSYITTTTFKPYYITESYEPKPASAGCPFSVKSSADTKEPKEDQQRTIEHRPDDQIDEDPYYYGYDPFCLTRHHVLIPAIPVMLPQWCFVPDTPDFMCPRYDLGFHIAFAHETQRDMYYRCVYGQAVMLKCPNLHYWDDERKICTLMTDFSHYQRHHSHRSHQTLHDQATHHHCQQCRRNFLRPQDLDPTAQCSDRMLLACNTDGTLSVYECPGFYYYDRHIQLRWYADLERCDYPADGDGPWSR